MIAHLRAAVVTRAAHRALLHQAHQTAVELGEHLVPDPLLVPHLPFQAQVVEDDAATGAVSLTAAINALNDGDTIAFHIPPGLFKIQKILLVHQVYIQLHVLLCRHYHM